MPDTHPITVAIVPHTHWDREWYSPFQTFRMRLVKLLDALLPLLETDLSYARFLLDGQTAIVDDYLEVRPEAADTLRRLSASGRISLGPWMVQMDEFMVSGETMVRDLQFGLAQAAQYGGAMPIGYLPDIFGHIAQMPQLLRLVGIEHAVAWRGIPASVDKTGVLVGRARRFTRALRVPLRLVLERARHPRGREGTRAARGRLRNRARRRAPLRHAADERHRPPDAATVARARRRRGERHAGRLPLRRHVAAGVPPAAADRRAPDRRRRAALRRTRQPAHGRGVEPRRRAPGLRGRGARARTAGRADGRRCSCRPSSTRTRSSALRGGTSCSTARTTRRARAVTTKSSTTSSSATRKRARSATGSCATRCTRSRTRSTRHRRRPIVVNPTARARSGIVEGLLPGEGPCHYVAADGTALPDAAARRHHRRGLQDDGHRPEGAVGARPHARHRVRGPADRVLRRRRGRRVPRHRPAGGRAARHPLRPVGAQGAHARARRGRHDDAAARHRDTAASHPVRHRTRRRVRLGLASPGSTASRPPARSSRPMPRSGTSTSASRSTPRTAPTRSRRTTVFASAASAGSSTAATAATRTTTRRRPTTSSSTARTRCASTTLETGPVRARVLGRDRLHVARARDRRRGVVLGALDRHA